MVVVRMSAESQLAKYQAGEDVERKRHESGKGKWHRNIGSE